MNFIYNKDQLLKSKIKRNEVWTKKHGRIAWETFKSTTKILFSLKKFYNKITIHKARAHNSQTILGKVMMLLISLSKITCKLILKKSRKQILVWEWRRNKTAHKIIYFKIIKTAKLWKISSLKLEGHWKTRFSHLLDN